MSANKENNTRTHITITSWYKKSNTINNLTTKKQNPSLDTKISTAYIE